MIFTKHIFELKHGNNYFHHQKNKADIFQVCYRLADLNVNWKANGRAACMVAMAFIKI